MSDESTKETEEPDQDEEDEPEKGDISPKMKRKILLVVSGVILCAFFLLTAACYVVGFIWGFMAR